MSFNGHTRWVDPDQKPRIARPVGRYRSIWDMQIADGKAREIIARRADKAERAAALSAA